MTAVRRYTEDEIAEFLFGTDVEGLNREEIVEALNDWRTHMEAGGYPVGTGSDEGAVADERRRLIARIRELADSREYPNDAQAEGARWVAEVLRIEGAG